MHDLTSQLDRGSRPVNPTERNPGAAACLAVLLLARVAAAGCPARAPAPVPLPGVTPEQQRLDYWLARTPDPDAVLLAPQGARGRTPAGVDDLLAPLDEPAVRLRVARMLAETARHLGAGTYVGTDGRRLDRGRLAPFFSASLPGPLVPVLRVALDTVQLRCAPVPEPLRLAGRTDPRDVNACSAAHAQEVVQTLADWPAGMRIARTSYAMGWIADDAPLSPPIPSRLADAFVHGARVRAAAPVRLASGGGTTVLLPKHATVPLAPGDDGHVLVATAGGVEAVPRPPALVPTRRPLTRRALLTTAFSFLDSPWGYGGAGGGRDCSRLLLDLFASFDVALPRDSGAQARAGTSTVDLRGVADPAERLRRLDAAERAGIVLLGFPGHVMLYLGRSAEGVPMVLHALGDYREPCPDGAGETRRLVHRVVVSRLDLGRGSRRGSLLERTTTLTVFGPAAD
jgi:hypothetical protein